MKKIILAFAAVLTIAGCSGNQKVKSEAQMALEQEITRLTSPDAKVVITLFEKIDSTTYGEELEYRQKAFETKLSQDTKFYEKYRSSGMRVNMDKKYKAIESDKRIIEALAKMAEELGAKAGEIAYYDYHFSGKAETADKLTEFTDYYACIAAEDNAILSMENSTKGLHKTLGRVLPGYINLVKGEEQISE